MTQVSKLHARLASDNKLACPVSKRHAKRAWRVRGKVVYLNPADFEVPDVLENINGIVYEKQCSDVVQWDNRKRGV
jgi:hypothetical protein